MSNTFIDALEASGNLRPDEALVLRSVDVRDAEELHSLLAAFPGLASLGVRIPQLSNVALLRSSAAYAGAVRTPPRQAPVAFGAQPPSTTRYALHHRVAPPSASGPPATLARPATRASVVNVASPSSDVGNLDLRPPDGWPVRDQGIRGTCVAFAVSACREHLRGTTAGSLSPQFLFHAAKNVPGEPFPDKDGTLIDYARIALASEGICRESDWPYVSAYVHPLDGGPRPAGATTAAAPFQHWATTFHGHGNASAIAGALAAVGRPIALSLPVFADPSRPGSNTSRRGPTNWNTLVAGTRGRVLNPPPTASVVEGHAVCITGFVADPSEPAGGYFVFRNSWGPSQFGNEGVASDPRCPEPGYGSVSASYVDTYTWEWCQL